MKRRNIYQKRLILKRSLFVSLIILFFSFFLYRIAYSKFMYSGSVSGISVVPAKITGLAITYGNEINTEGKDYPISVKEGGTVLFNITDPIPSKIYVNDVEWPGYSCNNGRLLIDNITEDINITAEYNSMDKAIFKPNIRSTMISLAGSPSSITAIKYSDIIPEEVSPTDVADSSSETSINMWYSSGTIYWNSSNKNPIFSGNRTQELYYLSSLADIEGLRTWDTEGLTSMEGLLQGNTRINSVEALKYWNTSSVTNMKSLFNGLNTLTNISGLENWDVSHVEDMTSLFTDTYVNNITPISKWDMSNVTKISGMFQGDGGLNNISVLSSWDVSNVTEMAQLFERTSISNLTPISNWNVVNVQNMSRLFYGCTGIRSLVPLSNWKTNSLTNLQNTFPLSYLNSLEGLENWDVSHVNNFASTFEGAKRITSLAPIANWDVSSGTNFTSMFNGDTKLTADGVNSINNWQLDASATFTTMFNNVTNKPTFTFDVNGNPTPGTWDENGTLIVPS